jgi:hypothetical protein
MKFEKRTILIKELEPGRLGSFFVIVHMADCHSTTDYATVILYVLKKAHFFRIKNRKIVFKMHASPGSPQNFGFFCSSAVLFHPALPIASR